MVYKWGVFIAIINCSMVSKFTINVHHIVMSIICYVFEFYDMLNLLLKSQAIRTFFRYNSMIIQKLDLIQIELTGHSMKQIS